MNQKMNLVDLSKASTFFNIDLNVIEIYIIQEFIDIEKNVGGVMGSYI